MAQYTCITLQRCNWTVKETNNCMVYEENKEEKMLFDCAQHIWPFFFFSWALMFVLNPYFVVHAIVMIL